MLREKAVLLLKIYLCNFKYNKEYYLKIIKLIQNFTLTKFRIEYISRKVMTQAEGAIYW